MLIPFLYSCASHTFDTAINLPPAITVSFNVDLEDQGTLVGFSLISCEVSDESWEDYYSVHCPDLSIELHSTLPDGTEEILVEKINLKQFGIFLEEEILFYDQSVSSAYIPLEQFFPFSQEEGYVDGFDSGIIREQTENYIKIVWIEPEPDLPGKMELSLEIYDASS